MYFLYIPEVSDSENIYKYWVVYPHINTLIQNTGVEMKDLKISDMIDIPLQIVIP